MDRDAVVRALRESVERLFARDRFLLTYDVHECTIAHRIAVYLESRCRGFNVDCEYNNDLDSESGRKAICYPGDFVPEPVRPDIVVHHRGRNGAEDNLLVVELKKLGATVSYVDIDRQKLRGFTSADGRNHYSYFLGASLRLGVKDDAGKCQVEWFEDGHEVGCETWDV